MFNEWITFSAKIPSKVLFSIYLLIVNFHEKSIKKMQRMLYRLNKVIHFVYIFNVQIFLNFVLKQWFACI